MLLWPLFGDVDAVRRPNETAIGQPHEENTVLSLAWHKHLALLSEIGA